MLLADSRHTINASRRSMMGVDWPGMVIGRAQPHRSIDVGDRREAWRRQNVGVGQKWRDQLAG
jgi:hypothetical protein